jgi:adenylosuccinate lyase
LRRNDALSPVDGRYLQEVRELRGCLSERALFKERAYVELAYLKALLRMKALEGFNVKDKELEGLEVLMKEEEVVEFEKVKLKEKEVRHDIKALELALRDVLKERGLRRLAPLVHLGLTSEDVNNLAYGRLLLRAVHEVMLRHYVELLLTLSNLAKKHSGTKFLARTHGRPAVPTTLGKELGVFAYRLGHELLKLAKAKPYGKLNCAVGSYNSLNFLNPNFDWLNFSKRFVSSLGLTPVLYTKQIVPNEGMSELLHHMMSINMIMQELARDLWLYQALGLVGFRGEGIGSSTMPHKVNPIDVENAEGQVDISNSILSLLTYRVQQTRLQRDLSDSTIKRMYGQALAHSLIACKRLHKALRTLEVNENVMKRELKEHPEVLSEAVQVALRASGEEKGYEIVFESLDDLKWISNRVKGRLRKRLKGLKVEDYVGLAEKLAVHASKEAEELAKEVESVRRATLSSLGMG